MTAPVRLLLAAALVATTAAPAAEAQRRPSLADRVAALEQQANAPSPTLEALRQIEELREEVRGLRAQLEELQHRNEENARAARTQYLDVDARLQRLESAAQAPAAATPAPGVSPPATAGGETAAPSVQKPATAGEKAAYDIALAALKNGQYAESARLFGRFLAEHPDGPYAPNAHYWLGESYYVTENYALAAEEFQRLVQRYPRHDKTPGGMLKLGLAQFGLKQDALGRRTLEAVVKQYPGSDEARAAQQRLKPAPAKQ